MFKSTHYLLALVTALGVAASSNAAAPLDDHATAPLVIPSHADLGAVVAGTKLTTRVWLLNHDETSIRIEAARVSCGCTSVPAFEPFELGPAQVRSFDVEITAPKNAGATKSARLCFVTEHETQAVFEFEIAASHGDDVQLRPVHADLGEHAVGETIHATTWLINDSDEPIHLETVKAGCGCTTAIGFEAVTVAAGAALPIEFEIEAGGKPRPEKRVAIDVTLDDGRVVSTDVRFAVREVVAAKR